MSTTLYIYCTARGLVVLEGPFTFTTWDQEVTVDE
jgi:hypothetical protein